MTVGQIYSGVSNASRSTFADSTSDADDPLAGHIRYRDKKLIVGIEALNFGRSTNEVLRISSEVLSGSGATKTSYVFRVAIFVWAKHAHGALGGRQGLFRESVTRRNLHDGRARHHLVNDRLGGVRKRRHPGLLFR